MAEKSTTTERFGFAKDDSGHSYLIPADKLGRFHKLLADLASADTYTLKWLKTCEQIQDEFDDYRVNHIENYTFTDPKDTR